jgi:septal ring factor EnvC (AmiA/AmiB activator)
MKHLNPAIKSLLKRQKLNVAILLVFVALSIVLFCMSGWAVGLQMLSVTIMLAIVILLSDCNRQLQEEIDQLIEDCNWSVQQIKREKAMRSEAEQKCHELSKQLKEANNTIKNNKMVVGKLKKQISNLKKNQQPS